MCYSERLDKAAGYQDRHGYVLVGYKVVVQAGHVLMPWSPLYNNGIDRIKLDFEKIDPRELVYNDSSRMRFCVNPVVLMELIASMAHRHEHIFFPPRALLTVSEDRHPFHVAASEQSALYEPSANPFVVDRVQELADRPGVRVSDLPFDDRMNLKADTMLRTVERPHEPGVLVRVMVPEHAVDETNHVHAMMVIPPGERETEADITVCDAWNAEHKPVEPELDPAAKAELDAILVEANQS